MTDTNPFTVNGGRVPRPVPNPWSLLSPDEQAAIIASKDDWRSGLVDSLHRAGFEDADSYLAAVRAVKSEHPELDTFATDVTDEPIIRPPEEPPDHLVRQSRAAWHFAQKAGDRVRFDHGRGRWLIWAGHRWQPDEDGSINRLWLDVLADRYRLALGASDRERVRLTTEVQTAGATNSAIAAGLNIAASMEPIATTADAWDPDPWLLGCDNGVVELRTGHLRPGRPEDMISRSSGIAYDPTAECPRWMRFLGEVFGGDEELVDWYGLLVGVSLVGVMQEVLAIHHGLGNNGKSVGTKVLRHAIGDYAVVIPVETLVSAKRSAGEATPDLIPLRGARIAFTSEADQSAKLRGGVLKRLASVDRMSGRSLYGSAQTWDPTHTIHLTTNHLPAVDDATDGFWRRVALVPWTTRFLKLGDSGDGPLEDPALAATLDGELAGVLAWAVRGAVAHASGRSLFPFPAAVRARTDAYRAEEDKLGAFVAEHVIYDRTAQIGANALFVAYKGWCEAEELKPHERLGQKAFWRLFEERGGVKRYRDLQNRVFFDGTRLRLRTDGDVCDVSGTDAGTPLVGRRVEKSASSTQTVTTVTESPGPGASDHAAMTVDCRDYVAHQTNHRWTGEGWACDACGVAS
jgi:putative DNA primase/helicase